MALSGLVCIDWISKAIINICPISRQLFFNKADYELIVSHLVLSVFPPAGFLKRSRPASQSRSERVRASGVISSRQQVNGLEASGGGGGGATGRSR